MSEGTIFKAEKDFSKDVDALLPTAQELAKVCFMCIRLEILSTNNSIDRPTWRRREALSARETNTTGKQHRGAHDGRCMI